MRSLRVIRAAFEWPFSKMLFHQGIRRYLKAAARSEVTIRYYYYITRAHTLVRSRKNFFLFFSERRIFAPNDPIILNAGGTGMSM